MEKKSLLDNVVEALDRAWAIRKLSDVSICSCCLRMKSMIDGLVFLLRSYLYEP